MATLLFIMTFLVLIHLSESCGDPVDVKAALVNNGRSIGFTWRPPNTGSVEYYRIIINGQYNTTTDTRYLIQNPEKRLYTLSVTSYCGRSGGLSSNWVRTTIGFVGSAVYATIGQPSVSIGWRTTATINIIVDVKNKDINTNIFFLRKSNVPILYENQYKGRITYTGDLANDVISFTLSNVTSLDAGYYMSTVGITDMGGQVLVVLDKPRKPTIYHIFSYVGKPLELSCNSLKTSKPDYYTPELNYTWWIDGSVHIYNTRHQGRYKQNQNKLFIDNVTKEDKGRTFSCKASDRGQQSEQSNTITLDPRYGPITVITTPGNTNNVVKIGNQFGPINCTAECNPSCTFTWKFRKMGYDGPMTEITRSNILIISQVTRQHDGEYRCVAKSTVPNVLTSAGMKTIDLNVQFPPEIKNITLSVNGAQTRIINTGTLVVVSENDDVNLQCNIEADPKAKISWNRDGKTLNNISSGESLVHNLGPSISCETSGIYSCVADNGIASAVNRRVNLLVQCKPKQNRSLPVFNRYGSRLNSTVNISLSVIAYPRPSHKWETNTTAIVNERPISAINSYSFKFEGLVTIRRNSDFGTYCLQLTNNEGASKLCLEIQAEVPPEIKNITLSVNGAQARIIDTGTLVVVSENDDVNLQCNIEADPKAKISWNRDGKTLNNISSGESLVHNLGPSISCETSGIYSCVADNGIASAVNRRVHLLVQCKPKQKRSLPVSNRYGSRLNSTVNIRLSVIAYPRPSHKWETNTTALVNERPISQINSYSFKFEGLVTIRRISDFGTYCLQLTNNKGTSKQCLEIQAEDVPMEPSNFGVENVSPDMITLTWISEFNGGIQQTFYLEYKELENDAGFTKINVSDSGLGETIRVTVKELKAGVYYTFKLYSRNALGDSQAQVIPIRTQDYPVKEPETSSSTGVYVGVAWVVFVVILVIVGIVVFVVLRRRKGSVENSPGRVNTGLVSRERAVPPNILNLDTTQNPDDMYSEIADASMSENVKTSDRQTSGTEHDNRMDADGYLSPTDIEHLGQLDERKMKTKNRSTYCDSHGYLIMKEIEHEENSSESTKPYEKLLQEEPLPNNQGYITVQYPGKGVVDSTNV